MPGPFPGMDPYLEDKVYWPDVHHRLATYIGDELQRKIRPAYYAHIGERVYLSQPEDVIIPDVSVVISPPYSASTLSRSSGGGVAVAPPEERVGREFQAPEIIAAPSPEVREPFIKIMDARRGGKVVTIIEILSPSNKVHGSTGYKEYRNKQADVLDSDSHLVEIDLLRSGFHIIAAPFESIPPPREWDYIVSVTRPAYPRRYEIYRWTVREQLPIIKIPLSDPDPDVLLDLQPILERCYDNGSYDQLIDYTVEPPSPLRERDREWARELTRSESRSVLAIQRPSLKIT